MIINPSIKEPVTAGPSQLEAGYQRAHHAQGQENQEEAPGTRRGRQQDQVQEMQAHPQVGQGPTEARSGETRRYGEVF